MERTREEETTPTRFRPRWLGPPLSARFARAIVRLGLGGRQWAAVETTGRRSGRRRRTPVCNGFDGATFWLMSTNGHRSDYVRNLVADPSVRVRVGRRWIDGTAHIEAYDDTRARQRRWVAEGGLVRRVDAVVWRRTAHTPLTIRIDLDDEASSAARTARAA